MSQFAVRKHLLFLNGAFYQGTPNQLSIHICLNPPRPCQCLKSISLPLILNQELEWWTLNLSPNIDSLHSPHSPQP